MTKHTARRDKVRRKKLQNAIKMLQLRLCINQYDVKSHTNQYRLTVTIIIMVQKLNYHKLNIVECK